MNINLDDKRIKKIVYQLQDGRDVAYTFHEGDLLSIHLVTDAGEMPTDREMIDKAEKLNLARYKGRIKNMLSDSEMIEKIRNSEFMDELEDARKRFKLDKEIADGFPDEDPDYGHKVRDRKYSDESLEAVKKIIEMDKNGELDKILKRHNTNYIDRYIRTETESTLRDSELADDSSKCQMNMDTIETKILARLRMSDMDITKDSEFEKLVEDYNFYKTKKKEIDDKIWAEIPKVEKSETPNDVPNTCIPKEVRKTPIHPDILEAVKPLNLSELK